MWTTKSMQWVLVHDSKLQAMIIDVHDSGSLWFICLLNIMDRSLVNHHPRLPRWRTWNHSGTFSKGITMWWTHGETWIVLGYQPRMWILGCQTGWSLWRFPRIIEFSQLVDLLSKNRVSWLSHVATKGSQRFGYVWFLTGSLIRPRLGWPKHHIDLDSFHRRPIPRGAKATSVLIFLVLSWWFSSSESLPLFHTGGSSSRHWLNSEYHHHLCRDCSCEICENVMVDSLSSCHMNLYDSFTVN